MRDLDCALGLGASCLVGDDLPLEVAADVVVDPG